MPNEPLLIFIVFVLAAVFLYCFFQRWLPRIHPEWYPEEDTDVLYIPLPPGAYRRMGGRYQDFVERNFSRAILTEGYIQGHVRGDGLQAIHLLYGVDMEGAFANTIASMMLEAAEEAHRDQQNQRTRREDRNEEPEGSDSV